MVLPFQCPCIECQNCGIRYILIKPIFIYDNGAKVEAFPVGDSDSRKLLCSCGNVRVFSGAAVKNCLVSAVAYERGYDYDVVPRSGIEDY